MENDSVERYLDALQREDCYRVDEVLKESEFETTERVSFVGANGSAQGPYIRKLIAREAGLGTAYERIYSAQQAGKRFKYVPKIIECYRREDALVVVMECVTGRTLDAKVRESGGSVELACAVFPQLCDAVLEFHEGVNPPLIHRDLKPSNIILADQGLALIDFGIARTYDATADTDTTHLGTRPYAPPEQYGFGQTTIQSDIYALGMVLYFCLTGDDPTNAIRANGFSDFRVPESMARVLVRATAFDPAARYVSALVLKQAFFDALHTMGALQNGFSAMASAVPMQAANDGRSSNVNPASRSVHANGVTRAAKNASPVGPRGEASPAGTGRGTPPDVPGRGTPPATFGGEAPPAWPGGENVSAVFGGEAAASRGVREAAPTWHGGDTAPATFGVEAGSSTGHASSGREYAEPSGVVGAGAFPVPAQAASFRTGDAGFSERARSDDAGSPRPSGSQSGVSHVIGKVWNFLLSAACALFCFVSFSLVNSPDALPEYTASSVAVGYGIVMPLLIVGTTIVLFDKRRLKRRFKVLERMNWRKWTIAYVVLILVVIALIVLFVKRA